MKIIPIDLNKNYTGALSETVKILQTGGIIVYPTDTVYCFGANACDKHAVELVFKIKKRPLVRPLPIIVRNIKWVKELAFVPPKLESVLENIWPSTTSVFYQKRALSRAL
ncbi:MAG: Sua5/YciO/YrdC/YwlC family protein [Candidatus Yanofskybacteria bacterium]|nr:Sua5/YciO/YrdC/YwlC family protein [Candidatus Yanofskybacteria bacterium]